MDFLNQLSPFIENVGFPALIFAIWYIYHQSQVKAFEKIIQNINTTQHYYQESKTKLIITYGVRC